MTVNDIIKAQECCYFLNGGCEDTCSTSSCSYCQECPIREVERGANCQKILAQLTIDKLKELVELLDDKVNHHYYDTLEFYQEENNKLINKLNKITEALLG